MESEIQLLEINGNTIFPLRGASGGIALSFIAYLITVYDNKEYSFPIEFIPARETDITKFNTSNLVFILMERLDYLKETFYLNMKSGTARGANFSGGDLGRASDNGIIIEF